MLLTRSGRTRWSPIITKDFDVSEIIGEVLQMKRWEKIIIIGATVPHLSYLPVNVPLLHVGEPPRGDRQARGHVNTNQAVVGDPQNFILLTASKSERQIKGQIINCK